MKMKQILFILSLFIIAFAVAGYLGYKWNQECRAKGGLRVAGVCFDVRVVIP